MRSLIKHDGSRFYVLNEHKCHDYYSSEKDAIHILSEVRASIMRRLS